MESRAIAILDTFTTSTNTIASVKAVQHDVVRVSMLVIMSPMAEFPVEVRCIATGLLTIVPNERTLSR